MSGAARPLDDLAVRQRGEAGAFYYQRYGSPTVAAAEAALGKLDGGTALLFPSGAGATTALVLTLLQPGDTIALAEGAYFGTGTTFETLGRWGLRVVEFDQTGAAARERRPHLARGAVESVPHDARPRGGRRASGSRPRRRDRGDADPPPAARARRRLRRSTARRSTSPATTTRSSASSSAATSRGRGDARVPHADGDRRRARPGLAPPPRAEDARAPRAQADRDGAALLAERLRRPLGVADRALSRLRRPALLRRRRCREGARRSRRRRA